MKNIVSLLLLLCIGGHLMAQQNTVAKTDTSYFKPKNLDANLLESVIKNSIENTLMLLKRGANPNALSTTKNSALMYATEQGNMEIMRALVESGADVNHQGFGDETALFLAIFKNDFQAAKFLLENGANPNVKDSYGVTPLIYASATNQYQSADLLLFYEADPDVTDKSGNGPLISAVTFENLETTDVLLQNGLNPDVQDHDGNTSSIIATQHGAFELLDLLLEYNADVNLANKKHYTPLAYAVTYGDVKSSELLISKGADVNHMVGKKHNISDIARISGNDSLIQLVQLNGGKQMPGLDFSEFNITYGNSFNRTDYLVQFRGGLIDSKYGYYFETGVDYRPYLLMIQNTVNDTIFQYRERRIGWSHSIGKYQKLFTIAKDYHVSLYASLNGYLSFPRYMGSSSGPAVNYNIIPSLGMVFYGKYLGFKAGADWYNFSNEIDKGLKLNLSAFFRISYPEVHYDRKEIFWE